MFRVGDHFCQWNMHNVSITPTHIKSGQIETLMYLWTINLSWILSLFRLTQLLLFSLAYYNVFTNSFIHFFVRKYLLRILSFIKMIKNNFKVFFFMIRICAIWFEVYKCIDQMQMSVIYYGTVLKKKKHIGHTNSYNSYNNAAWHLKVQTVISIPYFFKYKMASLRQIDIDTNKSLFSNTAWGEKNNMDKLVQLVMYNDHFYKLNFQTINLIIQLFSTLPDHWSEVFLPDLGHCRCVSHCHLYYLTSTSWRQPLHNNSSIKQQMVYIPSNATGILLWNGLGSVAFVEEHTAIPLK